LYKMTESCTNRPNTLKFYLPLFINLKIFSMKKISLLLAFLCLIGTQLVFSQTREISGSVVSGDDGTTVPGASVVIKGTTVGTITDKDGKFSLKASIDAKVLVVTFVGMAPTEVPLTSKNSYSIKLSMQTVDVDEVMVVAYGSVKKASFTGSAEVVGNKTIERIQTASVAKALEGVAPGIQVTGGTGQPGSSASVRIRGIGSVNASSNPLYVVDGAPFDGNLNSINNNDIESVTVLKDATSAALYGARGANGVIIITTKKGGKGKSVVNFKSSVGGVSRAIPEYDMVNTQEYYQLMWEGWYNALVIANKMTPSAAAAMASGGTSSGIVAKLGGYNSYNVANDQLIGLDGKLNPSAKLMYSDNWNQQLAQTGVRQDYNFSINGGDDKGSYFASVSYLDEQGMVKWSNYDRLTARFGVSKQVKRWLKYEGSVSGSSSNQNGFVATGTATTNPFYFGRMLAPIYPIYQYDAEGKIIKDTAGNPVYDMGGGTGAYKWAGHTRSYAPNANLMVTLPLDERSNKLNTISARSSVEISFLKNFKLKILGNIDLGNYFYTTYQNNVYGDAQAVKGRSTKQYFNSTSKTLNEVLTWAKIIGNHDISLLAGHENYQYKDYNVSATRTGFTIPTTELVAASVAEGSTSLSNNYSLEGYFFQANYNLKSKYYLSGSFRTDGSSRFYADSRWGSFWSIGGSWRVKEESFMNNLSVVDNLKLKASFGEQGNDDINNYYGWQSLYSINGYNNGTLNGAIHSQLENKTLQWEKNANLNVGLEFGIFKRVRGEIDYFVRESKNLLFSVPLPQSTGISSKWSNIGTMKNNGIEVQLSVDIVKMKDLLWTIDINTTTYKNAITKMPVGPDGKPQEIVTGTKKLSEGHSVYDFWLREYASVDPTDGSALYYKDIKDTDGNVTGRETTKDQNAASYYYVGSSIPKWYGGVTNNISYKGFDLSVLVTYQLGGKMYDSGWAGLMHPGSFGTNWTTDIKNRWMKPGDITDVPRLQNNYTAATAPSSRYLTDATFYSLRNVTLGYTLPKKISNIIDIENIKIFASGDNLGMKTKRKGMDPQQSFAGTSDWSYVPSRVISFGVNVTF